MSSLFLSFSFYNTFCLLLNIILVQQRIGANNFCATENGTCKKQCYLIQEFEVSCHGAGFTNVSELSVHYSKMFSFKLKKLILSSSRIQETYDNDFSNWPNLEELILTDNKDLRKFSNLNDNYNLESLVINKCQLISIPDNFSLFCPNLRSLDLSSNLLTSVPDIKHCQNLAVLNLGYNRIKSLGHKYFNGMNQLLDLLLNHNSIEIISNDTFQGVKNLETLDLGNNRISFIDAEAFSHFNKLRKLNVGNNIFKELPVTGLQNLQQLQAHNNPHFRDFPDRKSFKKIQTLALSYAYHCCAFLNNCDDDDTQKVASPSLKETVFFPHNISQFNFQKLWNLSEINWSTNNNSLSRNLIEYPFNDMMKLYGTQFPENVTNTYYKNTSIFMAHNDNNKHDVNFLRKTNVKCIPLPGPFQPCRDLFDWWTLRCGVWIIFLLAVLGNGTVVIVLLFSRTKMDVPRFLVCNLAVADFFMGVYLGLLAFVDASTLGQFRKFAIPWQMSIGCKIAGFLGVFSTELSVFTLSVITLERNYAITHAMHLNKRLSLRHAGFVMLFGWSFAIFMASLPLYGVSDYRKFAICLPFETNDTFSLVYIIILICTNGLAFFILMGCYLRMYCAIKGSQAWNSNDSRIAKRMSLLVFTDFLCWSPIAFFTLTALSGVPLLSLEGAKVLTVFVLPFNSCCNPFLYAIMTKQFKKDCIMICKAIEESRITRGIGRCRHSSNFSNRQTTPLNTDSLLERSSQQENRMVVNRRNLLIVSTSDDDKSNDKKSLKLTTLFTRNKIPVKTDQRITETTNLTYQIAEIHQKQQNNKNVDNSKLNSTNQQFRLKTKFNETRKRIPPWRNNSYNTSSDHRKISSDSNISTSRNDSSSGFGSMNSSQIVSTSSNSGGNDQNINRITQPKPKPKLTRQQAVLTDDCDIDVGKLSSFPNRLTVRFLTTIPSTPEMSNNNDDECDNEIFKV